MRSSWGCLNSQLNQEMHARFLVFSLLACVDRCLGLVPLVKIRRMLPVVWVAGGRDFFFPFYICFWNIACVHVWAPIVNNSRWKLRGHVGRLRSLIFKGSEHLNLIIVKCFHRIKCIFLGWILHPRLLIFWSSCFFYLPFSCVFKLYAKSCTLYTKSKITDTSLTL